MRIRILNHRGTEAQRRNRENSWPPNLHGFLRRRTISLFSLCLCASVVQSLSAIPAAAHDDDKKLPPTKAKAELAKARQLMDVAKKKLTATGKYACCVKPMGDSKVGGCDLCAKEHGSCNCGASLALGKGVCGDCLAGWKSGKGAMPNVKPDSVQLLHSGHQAMLNVDEKDAPAELTQAREILNGAKRTLVQEKRFSCCVGQGGCDECAYEASCPCAKQMALKQEGKGICGQCFDGQHAGHGRIGGTTAADAKLSPMEDHHMMMDSFAGIPESRDASGTSWQPDSTPMYAKHSTSGLWKVMQHYNGFLSFDHQGGPRGDDQVNGIGWYMLMGSRPVGKGELTLRTMLSPEPLTVGKHGYPLLFQSGESVHGKPLVDAQHPHDLFMELAARYRYPLDEKTAAFLYVAPSGEPAIGPTAFPHRLSAANMPLAPISHHWQDGTHITFGVLTAGVSRDRWQLEGSYFNGREPDERRLDIDPIRFNSYAGRVSFNPGPNWSLQGSYAYIKSPEALRPDEDVRRSTFSASYNQPLAGNGNLAAILVWGRNNSHGANTDSVLFEADYNIANKNTIFGRLEHVDKLGEELLLTPAERKFGITELTLGAIHELTPNRSYNTGVGGSITFNWKPKDLDSVYGSDPIGFWLFLRIRPAAMKHGG